MDINIAAILTVHNRKQLTLDCLRHLFAASHSYNTQRDGNRIIKLTVFLTDDGCTDNTANAVRETFPHEDINILQGTGSLFWAGGMRFAWQAAIHEGTKWDYFLLLNDDTNMMANAFNELFEADEYEYQHFGKRGISSGITCKPKQPDIITYGGLNFVNKTKGRQVRIVPIGHPQPIDLVHANILLIHNSVLKEIGMFYQRYIHACADNDYSMMANRHHIPVFSTSHVCGECDDDHATKEGETKDLINMTLNERKAFINSPIHSDKDYLLFVRRNMPLRYPISLVVRSIRLYFPKLYYQICKSRGIYKK